MWLLFCVQNLYCNDSKYSLLQAYIAHRVSFIFHLNVFLGSICTRGFAYLLCWPRGRGIGLVCTGRFSFHEFYNFSLFIFLILIFFLPTTFTNTHTHDPHPRPTTSTHYPRPTTFSYTRHELLEYRYMDDVTGNFLNLFCSKWRAVLKILVRLFRIKQVKASKKANQGLFTKRKNGERETKSLNYKKCLQQLPSHRVSSLPETRCFANVFAIILVWARKDVEKLFEETVYQ